MAKRKGGGWAAPVPQAPRPEPRRQEVQWLAQVGEAPTVKGLRDALDFFERFELEVVERLRADGASWNDLRHAYGVTTPQGARLRVLRLRERLGRPERL